MCNTLNAPCMVFHLTRDIVVIMAIGPDEQLDHIREAIRSLRNQSFNGSVKIYCHMDGSQHPDVLKFAETETNTGNFYVSFSTQNHGLATSLNSLIDCVLTSESSAYIARMDADDIAMPERFARQVDFLEAHPEISVVGSWLIEFKSGSASEHLKKLGTDHDSLQKTLFWRCPLNHPTVVFRRRVFEEGYRYRPELRVSQDYELWIRLVLDGHKLANIAEPLLRFRLQNNFLKKRGAKKAWLEFKYKMNFLVKNKPLYFTGYLMIFTRLFIAFLPSYFVKVAYRITRTSV